MKYNWEDLPEPLNCFTVRNATMINLNTGGIVQHYSANTKIVVVQKCVASTGTYYRTYLAKHHYLNYAFKASAFGLPDEKAPSVPSTTPNSLGYSHAKLVSRTLTPATKTKKYSKSTVPKDGEGPKTRWIKRIFRRKK